MKIIMLVSSSHKDMSTMSNYIVSRKQAIGERYYLLKIKDQHFLDLDNYLSELYEKIKDEYDGLVLFSLSLLDKKKRDSIRSFFEKASSINDVEIMPIEGKWVDHLCYALSQRREIGEVIKEFEEFHKQFSYQYRPNTLAPNAIVVDESILETFEPIRMMVSSLGNSGYKILLIRNTSGEIDESDLIRRFNQELNVNVIVYPKVPNENREKYLYRISVFWNIRKDFNVKLVLESDASSFVEFWKAGVPVICIGNPYLLSKDV